MAGMKFSMEADALSVHHQKGDAHNADLRTLVQNLLDAAEPLSKTFNGPAKAAFNNFKQNADQVADDLHNAHTGLMTSVAAQNTSFVNAAEEGAAMHQSTAAGQDFTAAVTKNV